MSLKNQFTKTLQEKTKKFSSIYLLLILSFFPKSFLIKMGEHKKIHRYAITSIYQEVLQKNKEYKYSVKEKKDILINDGIRKLNSNRPELFLGNSWLVASLYYSKKFINSLNDAKRSHQIDYQVIGTISDAIHHQNRNIYIDYLDSLCKNSSHYDPTIYSIPVEKKRFGNGENHTDAVDIFIEEGAPVFSITSGVVVLAENQWDKNDSLSTSSYKGGNAVIVYYPETQSFYRYAHLAQVNVNIGDIINGGTQIGTVGNSGINAHQLGHGNHLHMEKNSFNKNDSNMYAHSRNILIDEINSIP